MLTLLYAHIQAYRYNSLGHSELHKLTCYAEGGTRTEHKAHEVKPTWKSAEESKEVEKLTMRSRPRRSSSWHLRSSSGLPCHAAAATPPAPCLGAAEHRAPAPADRAIQVCRRPAARSVNTHVCFALRLQWQPRLIEHAAPTGGEGYVCRE